MMMMWAHGRNIYKRIKSPSQIFLWRWSKVAMLAVLCGLTFQLILFSLFSKTKLRQPPGLDSLLALQKTLRLLDPRFIQQQLLNERVQQDLLVAEGSGNETDVRLEVCPEQYLGPTRDLPYHTHAFTSRCGNQLPLAKLVTLALDATGFSPSLLRFLLKDIFRHWNVPVVVAASSSGTAQVGEEFRGVSVVRVTSGMTYALKWILLLKIVRTKYVLVGRNIISFSIFSDLRRLIRAFRMIPYVAFVSGATRSEQGNWNVACYQSRLELFDFALRKGYTRSAFECMYCDAVGGPFLTKTTFFNETPLDTQLSSDVVFIDWFLRVHSGGRLGTICPDVLFFTSENQNHPWENRMSWIAIAKKWGVTSIHLPGNIDYHFTCLSIGLNCNAPRYHHLGTPPCCLARLSHILADLISAFETAFIKVHLFDVTVVHGVKGGFQPWVNDIHLAISNTTEDIKMTLNLLQTRGFKINYNEVSDEYSIQVFSRNIVFHPTSVDLIFGLPPTQREVTTRLCIGNARLPGPPNPGLYSRGLLGPGSLLHRPLGQMWPPCLEPGHHACLDRLPLDGSVRSQWEDISTVENLIYVC